MQLSQQKDIPWFTRVVAAWVQSCHVPELENKKTQGPIHFNYEHKVQPSEATTLPDNIIKRISRVMAVLLMDL